MVEVVPDIVKFYDSNQDLILLDLKSEENKVFRFKGIEKEIIELVIDGKRDVQSIIDSLEKDFEFSGKDIGQFIHELFSTLALKNIIKLDS